MQTVKEELKDVAFELELVAAEVELTFDFAGHIYGYFDQPAESAQQAQHAMNELRVLTSVQLDRLHKHVDRLKTLVDGIYALLR